MFRLRLLFTLSISFLIGLMAQNGKAEHTIPTVTSLELSAYLGRWYMMYTSQIPFNTFLQDAYCIVEDHTPIMTANFAFNPNEAMFTMHHFHRVGSPNGHIIVQEEGTATNHNFLATPGQFTLEISGHSVQYHIIALGDITERTPERNDGGDGSGSDTGTGSHTSTVTGVAGTSAETATNTDASTQEIPLTETEIKQYPWAIITDDVGSMLFILARDTTEFIQKYEQTVLNKVYSLGFTRESNKPMTVYQSVDCVYPINQPY